MNTMNTLYQQVPGEAAHGKTRTNPIMHYLKNTLRVLLLLLCIQLAVPQRSMAQTAVQLDINTMTKDDVLKLSYDQLLELPFEDLLKLAEIVGVSLDELYEMILNKDLVSASKKVESSFESPLSSSVVSNDEMRAAGVRTIEEALRLVPGFIVREKTNGNFDAHIRGNDNLPSRHMFLYSENSITLVMIDNRPVYNYVHGGTFWETLPVSIEDVDRIEVVRGPSSALYGPNAVSGVVNIITKRQDSDELQVSGDAQGGMQNTAITSLALGKGLTDKLSFRVTGNFETMDRNTDKLYVHKANDGQGGMLTPDELAVLPDPGNLNYLVFDATDDVHDMFPNPGLSRKRMGGNAYLFYDVNDDIHFDLKGGYQNSEVLSSTMGDNPTALAGRVSKTSYADFNASVKDLHAQISLLDGWQDIVRADSGFKVDVLNLNSNVEYDWHLGDLSLRPGVSYQLARYNDTPYLDGKPKGFLNQEREFSTTALSLRADYKLFKALRLIAAVRGEKYSTHDNMYLSYQAIASYNLNDKHHFRIVSSRANRSPFLVDTYANYLWNREGRPDPGYILFSGQKNLKLLTMDMLELGYRVKPTKKIQADLEVFQTRANNYGALYPDSVNLNGAQLRQDRTWVRMTFSNIDLESKQTGATATISWVATKDLVVKVFGTVQKTELTQVIPYTQDETIQLMLQNAYTSYLMNNEITHSENFPKARIDTVNTATPTLYGGFMLQYQLFDKLHFNLNTYYYTEQEFMSKYGNVTIEPKAIVNFKVSYDVLRNLNLYMNARNVLGAQKEFGFMDDIGTLVLFGAHFNF